MEGSEEGRRQSRSKNADTEIGAPGNGKSKLATRHGGQAREAPGNSKSKIKGAHREAPAYFAGNGGRYESKARGLRRIRAT